MLLSDFLVQNNIKRPIATTDSSIYMKPRIGSDLKVSRYYQALKDRGLDLNQPRLEDRLHMLATILLQWLLDKKIGYAEPFGLGYKISGNPINHPRNYGPVEFNCVLDLQDNVPVFTIKTFIG